MPILKVNRKKEEVDMAINLGMRATPPQTLSKRGGDKPKPKVFDTAKANVLDNLKLSIEEAKGRYGGTDTAGAALRAEPLPKAIRSKNWTVTTQNEDGKLMDEQCTITVRVGQALWACFETDPDVKDSEKYFLVDAPVLVEKLEMIESIVEGLDKDSALGKSFHALAIAGREKRGTLKHDPETDTMRKK